MIPPRLKHGLFFLVYLLVTVALIFGVLEITTRARHQAPRLDDQYGAHVSDRYLPYKPKPSITYRGHSPTDEFDYDYAHNSVGFRDVEHTYDKPSGVFRIVGLGDSFTYGAGALFEDTYLARLEAMLNARGEGHPRVEIIKTGISRYFPEPERMLLEHYGVRYRPDLVLVGFLPNDIVDTYLGLDAVLVDPSGYLVTKEAARLGPIGAQLYLHSHFFRVILAKYVERQRLKQIPPEPDQAYRANGFHEKDWQKAEAELTRIKALTDSAGARLVIVHIPQAGPWLPEHAYPGQRLAEWGKRNQVLVISTLPALQEASKAQSLYYEKDGHCRPAGYHVIADVIYRELVANNMVP